MRRRKMLTRLSMTFFFLVLCGYLCAQITLVSQLYGNAARIREYEAQISELRTANQHLTIQISHKANSDRIESEAKALGMVDRSADQIYTVALPSESGTSTVAQAGTDVNIN